MSNDYYVESGWPIAGSKGSSTLAQNETNTVEDGFDKLPTLAGNGDKMIFVNSAGNAQEAVTAATAKANLDLEPGTDILAYSATLLAIANGLTTDAYIPCFSGTSTASYRQFYDTDAMTEDSSIGVCSQQSIKAYVDSKYQTAYYTIDAPANTEMLFRTSVPTGWVSQTDLDGSMIFANDTSGGTAGAGTARIDSGYLRTSGANNQTHTHGVIYSWNVYPIPPETKISTASGSTHLVPDDLHYHNSGGDSLSVNVTSSTESATHTHYVNSFIYGMYVYLGKKS